MHSHSTGHCWDVSTLCPHWLSVPAVWKWSGRGQKWVSWLNIILVFTETPLLPYNRKFLPGENSKVVVFLRSISSDFLEWKWSPRFKEDGLILDQSALLSTALRCSLARLPLKSEQLKNRKMAALIYQPRQAALSSTCIQNIRHGLVWGIPYFF